MLFYADANTTKRELSITMRMKNLLYILLVATILCSCGSSKDIGYIDNSQSTDLSESQYLYDATIKPKDEVFILVNCPTSPEAAAVFNPTEPMSNANNAKDITGYQNIKLYTVDNDGYVDFPLIGKVKINDLTIDQAQQTIKDKIKDYFKSGIQYDVYIELPSYNVAVVGEVNRPGMFTVANEKINILEALAQAGDLTIYGVRDRVKLIREDATGKKEIHTLNLNDANIINSPYYYLQQNDIIYVEPNKVKSQNSNIGSMTTLWFSATSILISLTSLLYNILKK